ncbi:Succinyltransferase component of 2-oxoglutarate dehydrogenase complex, mitochondrial [Oopsacas minuta]|uniref:Dihydrolipoyllysine-residue succinyltransferase component of 2-oxoglutarate dehydrogenase complex, mitochondrial n=1 Tax=Oopsacas minuta TaxID=111878 RepID=A0AAV7K2F1_9METZ|nr:Succinyltransferase component of 2-oxoglutarate dehydrogenase complex, mitochondrial [Oopsacas minuta]
MPRSVLSKRCTLQMFTSRYSQLISSQNIWTSALLNADIYTVTTPSFADSITEGDVRWRCNVGDKVSEDEILGEIETDKTALPIHSSHSGVVEVLLVSDGDKVIEGQELLKIRRHDSDTFSSPANATTLSSVGTISTNIESSDIDPLIRETDVSESRALIPPTMQNTPFDTISSSTIAPVPSANDNSAFGVISSSRSDRRVKMSRMRLKISERLKASQNTAAMLTTFNEIDMSNIVSLRNTYKDAFLKKYGVKLGIMSTFLKSSAIALKEMPVVNAVIDGSDIVYRNYIDISVAIATSNGLVVPVIKDVSNMSFSEIEIKLNYLTDRAVNKQLSIDDLYGGTFTISNGGVFGSLYGTPIINPPQSAILGMHAIIERPIAINLQPVVRPMMYVALTYDHRLIDGREAVLFLKKIKSSVEEPLVMLLDI